MCGIAGYIAFDGKAHDLHLAAMTSAVQHRGPDNQGVAVFNTPAASVGFGHRRLSIIDLSALGDQPMSLDDQLTIVFNGEIYNFAEIKEDLIKLGHRFISHSDTEVILHAYREWGMEMIGRFTGMFAFALYDRQMGKVFLVRDRAGVKPLFYYHENGLILFGSELKIFHQHPGFGRSINTRAIRPYLQYGYVPAPQTIFLYTYKVMPGHYIEIGLASQAVTDHCYWAVSASYQKPVLKISEDDAKTETKRILTRACQYRMVSDVPVGVFLSGGYDSSAVAALLQQQMTAKLKTFTIGFEDASYNEAGHAKKIAHYLGTEHYEHYCTIAEAKGIIPSLPDAYDEPFGDSSAIPTMLVSRFAAGQVRVALSADGGDETFAGYTKYAGVLGIMKHIDSVPASLRPLAAAVIRHAPPGLLQRFAHLQDSSKENIAKLAGYFSSPVTAAAIMDQANQSGPAARIERLLSSPLAKEPARDHFGISDWDRNADPLSSMLAVDYLSYMSNDILTKVDRATMQFSLEGREPLLDHHIIEFVAQLPSSLKIKQGTSKYLLKEIVHTVLPKEMLERPKMGFGIPVNQWLREDLTYLFEEHLSVKALDQHGYFNTAEVQSMLQSYYKGTNENFSLLWYILMFQMWYERWMQPMER